MSTASERELHSIENNYTNTQAYKETNKNIRQKIHYTNRAAYVKTKECQWDRGGNYTIGC